MMSLEQFQELIEELGFTLSLSTARTLGIFLEFGGLPIGSMVVPFGSTLQDPK